MRFDYAAQFVKPYVKSQKNDAPDAEAICEAVQRPTMRFVPIKSAEQQAALLLHRTRDLLIRQRSSLISAVLAHFAEFDIVVHRGTRDIDRMLALLGEAQRGLPELAREMLGILAAQLREIAVEVQVVEDQLMAWHRSNEVILKLRDDDLLCGPRAARLIPKSLSHFNTMAVPSSGSERGQMS